jgi:WD40 repeat protein
LARSVPDSLAAVVRKAMAFARDERYPTVAALQAEITAYQTGFATAAENASLLKQLTLLIQRHRREFAIAAAAWLLITALAIWFVLNLRASERKATRHAEIAAENATLAQNNARIATDNEQRANTESEARRRALAAAQLALAEAAYREHDGPAMQTALAAVPADLRDGTWRYLLEQADTSLARVSTGSDIIRGVAAHPTQPGVFAVTDSTHRVTLLEARTGVRLLQFEIGLKKDKPGTTYTLAFSPDGERLAVGKSKPADTGGIAIHNVRDGSKVLAWDTAVVARLQFSPDGRRLLQSGESLQLWNAASGERLWTFTQNKSSVLGHITPDGQHVVVPHARAFHFLKMEDGADAGARGSIPTDVRRLAISPDGRTALCDGNDGAVRGMDLTDGRLLFASRLPSNIRGIEVAFTPDGERFVSVVMLSEGRQAIQVVDAKTGTPVRSLVGGIGQFRAIAVHPLSGELLIGGPNSRLWEIADTAPRWLLRYAAPHGQPTLVAAFAGNDEFFFGPAGTHPSALLDLRGSSTVWKPASTGGMRCAINSDGRIAALLTSSGLDRTRVEVVRREGTTVDALSAFEVPGTWRAVRMNPAGDRLIVCTTGQKRRLAVFDSATGAQQTALDDKSLVVPDLDWIGGGARIVGLGTANKPRGVAKSEEQIIMWDAATGQRLHTVAQATPLDVLAVAPDGRSFAAAGADKLVHVFDAETLAERQSFRAHDGPITALAWHPTRPIVATGSEDLTIKLWNLETGQRLETLRGPAAKPGVLTFSPSGQRLACAAWDRTVRIWEPKSLHEP